MARNRLLQLAVGMVALATLAGACGGSSGGLGGDSSRLTVVNASGSLWTCNYNPFNPNVNVDLNLIYEPLFIINSLDGEEQPWLATGYEWSNGNQTLTVDLRDGIKWSDGKPLTAKDVVFTFNVQKEHPELDFYALWSGNVLSSVSADGDDKVVFDFKRVSTTSLRYIIGLTKIRPEHVWAKVADPVKASTKKNPVGTGPYKIKSCSLQSVIYEKNDDYWQKGKPKVQEIVYPAFQDNPPANLSLKNGQGDWGGQFIPDVENYWVKDDPENRKIWYPPLSNVVVNINHTKPIFQDERVRQALAYAIDRDEVSEKAMYGYQKPAHQSAIVDTFSEWQADGIEADYGYDCDKAGAKLEAAGFTKNADGMYETPDGQPFQPELINNAGFTDWVASVKFIGQSMKACGIDLQVSNLAGQQFDSRGDSGEFDLKYDSVTSGPEPYYELRNFLYSKLTQPIGTRTTSNRGRWKDAETDELIEAYDMTLDENERMRIVADLQKIMVDEVPFIPVTQNVAWAQQNSARFTGWPTEEDPYANPAPYSADWEVVLLKLKPVEEK